jgi:hypothetical protein
MFFFILRFAYVKNGHTALSMSIKYVENRKGLQMLKKIVERRYDVFIPMD